MSIVVTTESLKNWVAALVAGGWFIALMSAIFTKDWTGLGIVTPVMMVVVTILMGYKREEKDLRDKKDGEH